MRILPLDPGNSLRAPQTQLIMEAFVHPDAPKNLTKLGLIGMPSVQISILPPHMICRIIDNIFGDEGVKHICDALTHPTTPFKHLTEVNLEGGSSLSSLLNGQSSMLF